MVLAATSSVGSGEDLLRDRLRSSILGRLQEATFMGGLCGKFDDSTTSLLQVMVKAAVVFVVEDRAELDDEGVIEELGKMLKKRKLGSLNDALLSALGEALHYALEKWPREDPKGTSFGVDASVQCEIPTVDDLDNEVIDHSIDTANEEKAIAFLQHADFPQELIERENEPIEDDAVEGTLPAEETGQENLSPNTVQRIAKEQDLVKEESYEDMDVEVEKENDRRTGKDDGREHNSEGKDKESERKLQTGAVAGSSTKKKRIDNVIVHNSAKNKKGIYMRNVAMANLTKLNTSDYTYDVKESDKRFKCTRCGKRFRDTNMLIGHINSHTGERPHQCNFCSVGFTSLDNLQNHERRYCKAGGRRMSGRNADGRKDAKKK